MQVHAQAVSCHLVALQDGFLVRKDSGKGSSCCQGANILSSAHPNWTLYILAPVSLGWFTTPSPNQLSTPSAIYPGLLFKKLKKRGDVAKLRNSPMEMALSQSHQAPENMDFFLWQSRKPQFLRSAQLPVESINPKVGRDFLKVSILLG